MEEKINYQLSISVNDGIVEIVITGEVTKNSIDRLHADVITIVKGKNAKAVLCDISALKGRYDEYAAAYFRTRSIPQDVRTLPSAIVDLSENAAFQSFYETTSANAGHLLKWFTDIETARTWLKSML
jgi:hypothetical protein